MILNNVEFIKSAADKSGFLEFDRPMIAVSGRSNVGKSTFINMLAQRNKLAKTSQTPGRTRLVNYFDFGQFVLADLPGYGFAKVSKTEKDRWSKMLDDFFAERDNISHIFALVDIRHKPSAEDMQMINFLNHNILPFTVIATKADKIGKSHITRHIRELAAHLKIGEADIIYTSAVDKRGREDVLKKIQKIIELY